MILFSIFLLAAAVHLYGEIKRARTFHKMATKKPDSKAYGFSIVISAHNEAKNLKNLLDDLLAQAHLDFEIILMLDRCTDGSVTIASEIKDPSFSFHVISETPEGFDPKKYALTQGIVHSKKEWILVTDGDCRVPDRDWISSYNQLIDKETNFILGASPYFRNDTFLSSLIEYETFQTAFQYLSAALLGKPYMGVGRNMAYRRDIFLTNDGFGILKGIKGGDDDLLVQKLANSHTTKINLAPEAFTFSQPSPTWKSYFAQKTRHLAVGRYYKKEIAWMLSGRSFVLFVLWLCFLILVGNTDDQLILIAVFGFVGLIKGLLYYRISKLLKMSFHLPLFPILDLSYGLLVPMMGIRSFFVKKYSWKK